MVENKMIRKCCSFRKYLYLVDTKTKQNKKPSGVINYLREQRGSVHFDKSKNLTR